MHGTGIWTQLGRERLLMAGNGWLLVVADAPAPGRQEGEEEEGGFCNSLEYSKGVSKSRQTCFDGGNTSECFSA